MPREVDPDRSGHLAEHQDSFLDVIVRAQFSSQWCTNPVNFNIEGLKMIQTHAGLGPNDIVVDLGSNSGNAIMQAEVEVGTGAQIIGVDPAEETRDFLLPDNDNGNFTFKKGVGEALPLPDNTAKGFSGHNVVFRLQDVALALKEAERVTKPGGVLAFSTNASDHGYFRHTYERMVAEIVSEQTGIEITPPPDPAKGYYLESLEKILTQRPNFETIDTVVQKAHTIITPDRKYQFLLSIAQTVNRTNVTEIEDDEERRRIWHLWREVAMKVIGAEVERDIQTSARFIRNTGEDIEPYAMDIVHRGMVVVRNNKDA